MAKTLITAWKRISFDATLVFTALGLCGFGLAILYSATGQDSALVAKQGLRIVFGIVAMLLMAQVPPATMARWSVWLYAGGVLLLVAVLIAGDYGKGAQRWLNIGVVRFQPSEFLKILMPMIIARYFMDGQLPPRLRDVAVCSMLLAVPTLLIARQPDLGTALLVFVAGFFAMFLAGVRWRVFAVVALILICSAPIIWSQLHDYQRDRVHMLLDPAKDPLGAGYHTIQSKIAVGSGGLYGKGWLNGTQSNLDFLPEPSTDFIFAVYCEEFGFVGVLALLLLYVVIIGRGAYIAMQAQGLFGKLLAGSLVLTLFTYVFINIGMVIGQLPVVGVPLPMVSYGGTSMVTILASLGILMSIHSHRTLLSDR